MALPPPLALVGLRGAGKSAAGRRLADLLGVPFADTDDEVERDAGRSVADIFAAEGEPGFRDRESAALAACLARGPLVLATGGGVVLRPGNRELLRQSAYVAWLTADPETLWRRVAGDPGSPTRRPALTPLGGAAELAALLAARAALYAEVASAAFPTEGESPEAVAAAILTAYRLSHPT